LRVDAQVLALGDGVDQFHLELLALVAEHLFGLLAVPDFLGERRVARDDLAHLALDHRQVLQRERLVGAVEVVEEPVLDHRPDGHLGAGKQLLHRLGHDVGAVVPDEFQRVRRLAGQDLESGIRFNGIGEVLDDPVELHRHRLLLQRLRDAGRDLAPRRSLGELAPAAIGKCQGNHRKSPAHSLPTNAGKHMVGRELPALAPLSPERQAIAGDFGQSSGTGSKPSPPHGWQRHTRPAPSRKPRQGPCRVIASMAYSEHVGR
jgi:hypothetical protein